MKRVGIVSCKKWQGKIQEELLIQQYLINDGIPADIICWEDRNINYGEYECLLLRSVWGYQDNYEMFKKWLQFLKESNIHIYNSADLLLENIRKDRQFMLLDKYEISHIPTKFIKDNIDLKEIADSSVIKPIISGSGNNTHIVSYNGNESGNVISQNEILPIYKPIMGVSDNGIMIQPYIPDIMNGEYACIFIDGINTHNMLRFPGIFTDKQKPIYLESIPGNVKELANKVASIPEFCNYLYMRVDIVISDGIPMIMEVELAEPDLLTKYIQDESIKANIIKTFASRLEKRL